MGAVSTEETRARKERTARLNAIRDAYAARGEHCRYCGIVPSESATYAARPTVDHAVPVRSGGCDCASNLVYCCRGCNVSKSDRTIPEARLLLRLRRAGWIRFSEEQLGWMRARGADMSDLDGTQLWFEEHGVDPWISEPNPKPPSPSKEEG